MKETKVIRKTIKHLRQCKDMLHNQALKSLDHAINDLENKLEEFRSDENDEK